jgi:MFS family permease
MNKKFLASIFIILSGEAIFMLPFLVPRLFRPLMLEAWNITNTDIGLAFSAYGFSAMISYILGGPFADKYPPRNLISLSLIITAVLSLLLIFMPSKSMLIAVYFLFGISTTFLMWGALIKVTHDIGGSESRSTAMGILDSGRGLTAAIMSTALITILSLFLTDQEMIIQKAYALKLVYIGTCLFTFFISVGIWFSLKNHEVNGKKSAPWKLDKMILILKKPQVWLLGLIILSSYCGYKNIDNYSIFLVDVLGLSSVEASSYTSVIFWARPFAALAGGIITDKIDRRYKGSRFLVLFTLLALGSCIQLVLALNIFTHLTMAFSIIIFAAIFAYALRAIYFSVFDELKIPENLIGTTVGIVSLVGFLPDMFFGAFTGHLIDSNPGFPGFQSVFFVTGGFLLVGALASLTSHYIFKKNSI